MEFTPGIVLHGYQPVIELEFGMFSDCDSSLVLGSVSFLPSSNIIMGGAAHCR